MKHISKFKDELNLAKTGTFCATIITELDTYDDPMNLIWNINKHLEEIASNNNKDICNENLELLLKERL